MILYFSGTGNSAWIAKKLGALLGEEAISINGYLKQKKFFADTECRRVVFVVPTYAWRIPRIVEQWILRSSFKKGAKVYFVMNCGDSIGNAASYVKALCRKKEFRCMGCAQVLMPENYIAMFTAPGEEKARKIVRMAVPAIEELAQRIKADQAFSAVNTGMAGCLLSSLGNRIFYPVFVHDKKFTADENCISCGKCAAVCPLNNIRMNNGKPQWEGTCTHCMACITGCPEKAIEYGKKSVGQPRYHCPGDI